MTTILPPREKHDSPQSHEAHEVIKPSGFSEKILIYDNKSFASPWLSQPPSGWIAIQQHLLRALRDFVVNHLASLSHSNHPIIPLPVL
ncbi:MAG: hypothetical protein ABSA58_15225 [Acetobacteraceae bacterium]|jgi:hypothetical protein